MTTLIIVIIVLLSVLTTPLTLKALIDRDKIDNNKGEIENEREDGLDQEKG